MDRRSGQERVTLPPLSSLTSSIDLERRRDHPSVQEPNAAAQTRPADPRGLALSELDSRDERFGHYDRRPLTDLHPLPLRDSQRVSAEGSSSHTPYSGLPSISAPSSSRHDVPGPSRTPTFPKAPARTFAESNRPRAYSSPHRPHAQTLARGPSLSVAAELDQLLEGLLYVQDINRRLGLAVGDPASPSIFHSPRAAEMLNDKILDELDTLSFFSRSRAEAVAQHLGHFTYQPPGTASSHSGSSRGMANQDSGFIAPPLPSAQTDHASWQPKPSRQHQPLDDRRRADLDYSHDTEAIEHPHNRRRLSGGAQDIYSASSEDAGPSFRAPSRAISLEYPRSLSQRQHAGALDRDATDLARFDVESRALHAQAMQYPYGHAGMLPTYPAEGQHQQQMELLDRRRLAGKGMKRVRKRKNEHHQECLGCQAKETPEWRKGPMGPRTLCNACGLLYAKLTKRKQQEAEAAAKASGKTAEEIVREREESPGAKQASLEALRAELNLVNGLRNRPTSSSAPLGDASILEAPTPRYQDEEYYETAPGRPWSGRYPDDAQPFAHQPPPSHRAAMDPSRSTSLGHADSFQHLPPMEPSAGPSASRPSFLPLANTRPYTGGAAAPSLPLPLHPGRQRSSTLQPPATHGYGSSGSDAHRRHHPYM